MIPLLIGLLIFLVIFLLITLLLRPVKEINHDRVTEYLLSEPASGIQNAVVPSFSDRVLRPAIEKIGKVVGVLLPAGNLEAVRQKLDTAGNPNRFSALEYYGVKVLVAGLVIPAGIWALRVTQVDLLLTCLIGAIILLLGLWLPDMVLQRMIESRQTTIRKALPDVLDLLVISVEAGIGFDGAIQKVVEKTRGPLSAEFARVLEQIRLGKPRAEALRHMAQRAQVPDLSVFIAAVTQAEQLGVSIVKVLQTQAIAARERRALRAREMGAKLPVKMLIPLVFCIFPSLFVIILAPGVIQFAKLFKALSGH